MNGSPPHRKRHLLVAVSRQGKLESHTVVDVPNDSGPLMKELGYRAVGAHPELRGQPFEIDLWSDPPRGIVVEAHLMEARSANGVLARISVPVTGFQSVAEALARRVEIDQPFQFHVLPCAAGSQVVRNIPAPSEVEDIVWDPVEVRTCLLPDGGSVEEPGPTRVIDRAATWLRCVFREEPYRRFLEVAAAETTCERAWIGTGEVIPGADHCRIVISEISELPAITAGRTYLRTSGREVSRFLAELGSDRILAHLHLHPREVEGQPLSPSPSTDDVSLAWDFSSQMSQLPCCFPIALFGIDADNPEGEVAVHGYENGLLSRIQLEVTK